MSKQNEKGNVYAFLKRLLEKDDFSLAEYDFKLEMKKYYKKYNTSKRHDKLIHEIEEKIDNEKNYISRWFAYKTLEGEQNGRKYIQFDCDNSNDTCELTKLIYYYLWGWEKGKKAKNYFGNLLILQEKSAVFGGDTMNSLGITMVRYLKKRSVKDCKKKWESKKGMSVVKGLYDFALYTSCIGNFVLVPKGFNGHRGIHPQIKDYWDLSLDYLAFAEKSAWLSTGEEPIKQKYVKDNKAFVKYINMFFLWDYVDKSYQVKPLFDSHGDKLGAKLIPDGDVCPEEEEFEQYFITATEYIIRRGLFMAAMLKIAVEYDERKERQGQDGNDIWHVSDIYKYIVEKVFLTDKTYSGYEGVIHDIKDVISKAVKENVILEDTKEEIFSILGKAQDLIAEVKVDANDKKASD